MLNKTKEVPVFTLSEAEQQIGKFAIIIGLQQGCIFNGQEAQIIGVRKSDEIIHFICFLLNENNKIIEVELLPENIDFGAYSSQQLLINKRANECLPSQQFCCMS